jgi:hypothetical protein
VEGPYSSPLAGAEANAPQQKPSETAVAGRAKRGRPTKCEVEKAGKRAEGEKAMEGKQRGKSEQHVKKDKEETKKTKKTKEDEGEGEGQAKKRPADCFQAGASRHQ